MTKQSAYLRYVKISTCVDQYVTDYEYIWYTQIDINIYCISL